jgi:hypothetical protein
VAPSEVLVSSRIKYWWECTKGHQFQATPASVKRENWCPYCGAKKLLPGFNDLETVSPELAGEWHTAKNAPLLPSQVIAGFHRKVWWKCPNGHDYLQSGKKRRIGQGCPTCAPSGFNPGKPARLYFLEHTKLQAYKVGITSAESGDRLKAFQREGWTLHALYSFDKGSDASEAEALFFRAIRTERAIPVFLSEIEMVRTGGWTETFSSQIISQTKVLQLIADSSSNGVRLIL